VHHDAVERALIVEDEDTGAEAGYGIEFDRERRGFRKEADHDELEFWTRLLPPRTSRRRSESFHFRTGKTEQKRHARVRLVC
jgi:hypothetical protein